MSFPPPPESPRRPRGSRALEGPSRTAVAALAAAVLLAAPGCKSWEPLTFETPANVLRGEEVRARSGPYTIQATGLDRRGPLVLATKDGPSGKQRLIINLASVDTAEVQLPPPGRGALIGVGAGLGGAAIVATVLVFVTYSLRGLQAGPWVY